VHQQLIFTPLPGDPHAMRAPRRVIHDPEGLNTGSWPVPPEDFITPVDRFFTRSHGTVPPIDADSWRLEIGGMVEHPRSYSLLDLMSGFTRRTVAATLVCAGLRREELLELGPLTGELPWGPEPVSAGEWTGVALGDLLQAIGVKPGARHVELIGLDQVERQGQQFGFGGSIDLAKAQSDEVLLATHLNGAPLPPAHGFPLRAVVPGWIGARSVKWLGRINLRKDPTDNYFQTQAYRLQRKPNPRDPRDVSGGTALTEVPVNSVILHPEPNQLLPPGRTILRGWAIGSGARLITRVEVAADQGGEWVPARILPQESAWTWAFWEAELDLEPGQYTMCVRASDSSGATQPSDVRDTWNVKGYVNNAWHRVPVRVGG
jgi:sulfite oxidase